MSVSDSARAQRPFEGPCPQGTDPSLLCLVGQSWEAGEVSTHQNNLRSIWGSPRLTGVTPTGSLELITTNIGSSWETYEFPLSGFSSTRPTCRSSVVAVVTAHAQWHRRVILVARSVAPTVVERWWWCTRCFSVARAVSTSACVWLKQRVIALPEAASFTFFAHTLRSDGKQQTVPHHPYVHVCRLMKPNSGRS